MLYRMHCCKTLCYWTREWMCFLSREWEVMAGQLHALLDNAPWKHGGKSYTHSLLCSLMLSGSVLCSFSFPTNRAYCSWCSLAARGRPSLFSEVITLLTFIFTLYTCMWSELFSTVFCVLCLMHYIHCTVLQCLSLGLCWGWECGTRCTSRLWPAGTAVWQRGTQPPT